MTASPYYEEVALGRDQRVRCLANAVWLRRDHDTPYCVVLDRETDFIQSNAIHLEVAVPHGAPGQAFTERFWDALEKAVREPRSCWGKILSLESDRSDTGRAQDITVHEVHTISRESLILPEKTLALINRNVLRFAEHRPELVKRGQSAKKGLLFHGPPGSIEARNEHAAMRARG